MSLDYYISVVNIDGYIDILSISTEKEPQYEYIRASCKNYEIVTHKIPNPCQIKPEKYNKMFLIMGNKNTKMDILKNRIDNINERIFYYSVADKFIILIKKSNVTEFSNISKSCNFDILECMLEEFVYDGLLLKKIK